MVEPLGPIGPPATAPRLHEIPASSTPVATNGAPDRNTDDRFAKAMLLSRARAASPGDNRRGCTGSVDARLGALAAARVYGLTGSFANRRRQSLTRVVSSASFAALSRS